LRVAFDCWHGENSLVLIIEMEQLNLIYLDRFDVLSPRLSGQWARVKFLGFKADNYVQISTKCGNLCEKIPQLEKPSSDCRPKPNTNGFCLGGL